MMHKLNVIANVIIALAVILVLGCMYLPKATQPIGYYFVTQGQGLLLMFLIFVAVVKVIKHSNKGSSH